MWMRQLYSFGNMAAFLDHGLLCGFTMASESRSKSGRGHGKGEAYAVTEEGIF